MRRAFHFELTKIWRRRTASVVGVITAIFSVVSAMLVVSTAEPAGRAADRGVTLESLADAGGGTEVFRTAISFAGFFVFVSFVGLIATEFTRGNVRTMLLKQPSRVRLLAGKLAALIASAAVILAGAEVLIWITARLAAPGSDIDTGDWTSVAALGEGALDYGASLFWVIGYAVLGTLLAVLVRSVTVAMAIGIGWAGPFEHIIGDAWTTATEIFPGLLLERFIAGGSPDVGTLQAPATVAVYVVAAAVIAAMTFVRRDVV